MNIQQQERDDWPDDDAYAWTSRRKELEEEARLIHKERYGIKSPEDEMITVCSKCKRASCWKGTFFCFDYMSASTVEITRRELEKMNLEHPSYWE
jgi:hypothetical protein